MATRIVLVGSGSGGGDATWRRDKSLARRTDVAVELIARESGRGRSFRASAPFVQRRRGR